MQNNHGRKNKKSTEDLFDSIECSLDNADYYFTGHGRQRSRQRKGVSEQQVIKILRSPDKYHEKRKDKFDKQHNSWNYSIRGKSVDGEDIRIAIAFEGEQMLVITVINLIK